MMQVFCSTVTYS